MTSNVGAKLITESKKLGFSNNTNKEDTRNNDYDNIKKDVMQELKKDFRPEFINRIDEIIVFHKLGEEDIFKIVDLMLKDLKKRLEEQGFLIEFDKSINDKVIKQGSDKNYGARPLRRAIQTIVEDSITDAIIDGSLIRNVKKTMFDEEGKIVFK